MVSGPPGPGPFGPELRVPLAMVHPGRTDRPVIHPAREAVMARTPAAGTRERILEVAAELFYARGVRAVGMSQIIDAAGCGKNLLYSNFPSKTDLGTAYLDAEAPFRGCAMRNYVAEFPGDDSAATQVALAFLQYTRRRIDRLARQAGFARPARVSQRIWLIHDGMYAMAARPWVRSKPAIAVKLVRDILATASRRTTPGEAHPGAA